MVKNLIYAVITIILILTVAVLYFTQKKAPSGVSDLPAYEVAPQNIEVASGTAPVEMVTTTTSTDLTSSTTPLFTPTTSTPSSTKLKKR